MIARRRGYTIVELMMALVVFSIGIVGIVSMQKLTSNANAHAKNLAIATHIAQAWQEQLAIDATQWGQASTAILDNTTWVDGVVASNATWITPAQNAPLTFGPGFDALGAWVDLTNAADAARVVFCTHVRLTNLLTTEGSRLVRTEVRVFWPKAGQAYAGPNPYCAAGVNPALIGTDTTNFHFVYKTSAVRQTPGFGGG